MKDGFLKDRAITYHVASKRLQYLAKNIFKTLFCKTKIGQTLSSFFNNEAYDKEIASRSDFEKMLIEKYNQNARDKRDEKLIKQFGHYFNEDDWDDYNHRNDNLMDTAKRFMSLYENMNDESKSNLEDNSHEISFESDNDFTM